LMLGPKTPPTFIPHGGISESEFTGVMARKDIVVIRRLAGAKDEVAALSNVESALYKKITAFLRKAGRDPLGIGPILDYFWRISLEAMNLSILYYGKDLERETVKGELVH